jgi:hypothetical protein
MKFAGSNVGDIVSQFYGPSSTTNYVGSGTANCVVYLEQIGASGSSVKVQSNIVGMYGWENGSRSYMPNPANWTDVATVSAAGPTATAITTHAFVNWVRVIVLVPGTNPVGEVTVGAQWQKNVLS